AGLEDAFDEHVSLVDEVGQAARARLLPELRARLLALGGEQGPDAIGQALPARGRDEAVELHVAHLVENAAVLGGRRHGQARYQKTVLSEGRAPSILGAGGTGPPSSGVTAMILVTGASGTVGSEVVKALGGRSARVRAGYRTRPPRGGR